MANPDADFPTSLHTPVDTTANADDNLGETTPTHTQVHGKVEQEILEIQRKLGVGSAAAGSATAGQVLKKTADGKTEWRDNNSGYRLVEGPEYTATHVYVQHATDEDVWYIYRRNLNTDAEDEASGLSDPETAWTNKEDLTYS